MLDDPDITPPIPSPATIARILCAAGVVDNNPRKRPRSALIRFSRPYAMQLWQLDAFSYRLAGGGTITIYHVVDDATRYDVGTYCAADSENSTDACRCLARAFDTYGVPQQLLTDNGTAFNQSRRGRVTIVQRFAADRGCQAIAGRVDHPQTQGKTERCHQTLKRFLDAHQPRSLAQARRWVEDFRYRYNHKRRHQSLNGTTPQQAWDSLEHHPSTGKPIPLDDLPTDTSTATGVKRRVFVNAQRHRFCTRPTKNKTQPTYRPGPEGLSRKHAHPPLAVLAPSLTDISCSDHHLSMMHQPIHTRCGRRRGHNLIKLRRTGDSSTTLKTSSQKHAGVMRYSPSAALSLIDQHTTISGSPAVMLIPVSQSWLEIVTSTRLRSNKLFTILDRQPLCLSTRNHRSLLMGDTDAFSPPRMAPQPQGFW